MSPSQKVDKGLTFDFLQLRLRCTTYGTTVESGKLRLLGPANAGSFYFARQPIKIGMARCLSVSLFRA